jgi:hypothetical protein
MRVSERDEMEKYTASLFNKIIAEKFPNLSENTDMKL